MNAAKRIEEPLPAAFAMAGCRTDEARRRAEELVRVPE